MLIFIYSVECIQTPTSTQWTSVGWKLLQPCDRTRQSRVYRYRVRCSYIRYGVSSQVETIREWCEEIEVGSISFNRLSNRETENHENATWKVSCTMRNKMRVRVKMTQRRMMKGSLFNQRPAWKQKLILASHPSQRKSRELRLVQNWRRHSRNECWQSSMSILSWTPRDNRIPKVEPHRWPVVIRYSEWPMMS